MKIRGILVEANDGHTYLLGIGARTGGAQVERPTVWRVSGSTYESLEETRTASETIRDQFELSDPPVAPLNHDVCQAGGS